MSTAELPVISHLTPDAKKQLFALLARDLLAGATAISVADADGELQVSVLPPEAEESELPPISAERQAELDARSARLHTAIPVADAIAELKRRAAQLQNQQS